MHWNGLFTLAQNHTIASSQLKSAFKYQNYNKAQIFILLM